MYLLDGRTDGPWHSRPTDQQTNTPTDRPTYRPSFRDAWKHKKLCEQLNGGWVVVVVVVVVVVSVPCTRNAMFVCIYVQIQVTL